VADFSTPGVGTFFGNAPESGRWIDFIKDELVPFIDANFRTLKARQSRGLTGEFLGGYVALKLAMLYPETFGSVYAMHPVGTGLGLVPFATRVDWKKLNRARSWQDLDNDPYARAFMAMAQAYLPNRNRPPFYCDFIYELQGDELVFNAQNAHKLQSRFLLDELLPIYADQLRGGPALAFDWGRYDPNPDHIYGNQALTRKLDAFAIEHTAEEYRGMFWSEDWIEHGRVQERVLPFFNRYLQIQP
jgi:pimeloyl-ACP methyl ester carboxylesterase